MQFLVLVGSGACFGLRALWPRGRWLPRRLRLFAGGGFLRCCNSQAHGIAHVQNGSEVRTCTRGLGAAVSACGCVARALQLEQHLKLEAQPVQRMRLRPASLLCRANGSPCCRH